MVIWKKIIGILKKPIFLLIEVQTSHFNYPFKNPLNQFTKDNSLNGSQSDGEKLGAMYAEGLKTLTEATTLRAKYNRKCEQLVAFKHEFDAKVPFYDELDSKYQLALRQIADLNRTTTELLFVLSLMCHFWKISKFGNFFWKQNAC